MKKKTEIPQIILSKAKIQDINPLINDKDLKPKKETKFIENYN